MKLINLSLSLRTSMEVWLKIKMRAALNPSLLYQHKRLVTV